MKTLGLAKVNALNDAIFWFETKFVKEFDAVRPIQELRKLAYMAVDLDENAVFSLTNQFRAGKYLFQHYLSLIGEYYYKRLPLGTRFSVAIFEKMRLVNGSLLPGMYEMKLVKSGIIYPSHRWLHTVAPPANVGAHVLWWHWIQLPENAVVSITQL